MGKCMKRVRDWTDKQDERLRRKLEALPQRTKLAVVLVIFTFFAVCALFTFGTALYQIGRENGRQIEIEHIRELNLPQKQDSINLYKYYDYGTKQKSGLFPRKRRSLNRRLRRSSGSSAERCSCTRLWGCSSRVRCG